MLQGVLCTILRYQPTASVFALDLSPRPTKSQITLSWIAHVNRRSILPPLVQIQAGELHKLQELSPSLPGLQRLLRSARCRCARDCGRIIGVLASTYKQSNHPVQCCDIRYSVATSGDCVARLHCCQPSRPGSEPPFHAIPTSVQMQSTASHRFHHLNCSPYHVSEIYRGKDGNPASVSLDARELCFG